MSKHLKKLLEWVAAGLVMVLLLSVVGAIGLMRWAHEFSARDEPPSVEKTLARRLRNWAQPAGARKLQNPVPLTPEVLKEARAHFADHCASCHGNDGRGRTEMGQHLYPRAPDMTAEGTQSLTDGELFHVIKHGVRLTGMPAWGPTRRRTTTSPPGSWSTSSATSRGSARRSSRRWRGSIRKAPRNR